MRANASLVVVAVGVLLVGTLTPGVAWAGLLGGDPSVAPEAGELLAAVPFAGQQAVRGGYQDSQEQPEVSAALRRGVLAATPGRM